MDLKSLTKNFINSIKTPGQIDSVTNLTKNTRLKAKDVFILRPLKDSCKKCDHIQYYFKYKRRNERMLNQI